MIQDKFVHTVMAIIPNVNPLETVVASVINNIINLYFLLKVDIVEFHMQ